MIEQEGLTQGSGKSQPCGARENQIGRGAGMGSPGNAYGLALETLIPITPSKGAFFKRFYLFLEREKEREKHRCVIDT